MGTMLKKVDQRMFEEVGCYVTKKKNEYSSCRYIYVTTGLKANYGIPDLECMLDIPIETMRALVKRIVALVKSETTLKTEWLYDDVLCNGYQIEFKELQNSSKYRLVLPDENGFFPNDPLCDIEFKTQYIGTK